MELKGILSISGHNGLFKHIANARNGLIVESLITKRRMQAFATAKISALEDIAIYTNEDDARLIDVLQNIYRVEDGGVAIDSKSPASELKKYFVKVLPDYDQDRVYVSDIKRVISWYNTLHNLGMVDLENLEAEKVKDAEKADETVSDEKE